MYTSLEARSRSVPLKIMGAAATFIFLPIMSLFFAAVYWAAFNAILGGTATFKQVLAVVTHSQVIGALGVLIAIPIQLMSTTMSMAGPFNLRALAPWLEEGSKLGAFLGSISVFNIWGLIVTAIGLSVLYRRSARNIAIVLIVVFLLFMYALSSVFGSFMGGGAS
jgi:Yip1 domain